MTARLSGIFCQTMIAACLAAPCLIAESAAADTSSSTPAAAPKVKLINGVSKCLQLGKPKVVTLGTTTQLLVPATAKGSVGTCGCTSPLLAYRLIETLDVDGQPQDYERAFGLLSAPSPAVPQKQLTLVLTTDREVRFVGALSAVLSCKQPD